MFLVTKERPNIDKLIFSNKASIFWAIFDLVK